MLIRVFTWIGWKSSLRNNFGKRNMKSNQVIFTILITTCLVLLQAGCEEESMAPQQELSADWFRQFDQMQRSSSPTITPRTRFQTRAPKLEFETLEHNFGNVGE
jgi:hypothetical protein